MKFFKRIWRLFSGELEEDLRKAEIRIFDLEEAMIKKSNIDFTNVLYRDITKLQDEVFKEQE